MDSSLFRYVWHHSRRDQILILVIVLASLPSYFASFDVPKKIINDAIQGRAFQGAATTRFGRMEITFPDILGGGSLRLTEGFEVTQLQYLWLMCAVFLTLVIINGGFKYLINFSKGVLGERMLRRMRFEMFSQFLRFRPEDLRTLKPAEAATIIKDEVETIGSFVGDAFVQPAFLAMQALTALIFIMVQSFWLGLMALVIVLMQAVIIPGLRREQLRLSRERQIEQRKLAGRIGEVVETMMAVRSVGATDYTRADIGGRLGTLFKIRVDLFNRKFAVKFLNNLLAQITPFFFYAIGGYLAITGSLNIGQLVAVITAYRDLPPPIKELIDWDQQRADAVVKWQQVLSQFPTRLLPLDDPMREEITAVLDSSAPIRLKSLKASNSGGTLLDATTLEIPRPSHAALIGASPARDVVAGAIGRQIFDVQGQVTIGPVSLLDLSDRNAAVIVGYVGPDPNLFSGTIRDNVLSGLRRRIPTLDDAQLDAAEKLRRIEAKRSGNPLQLPSDDWIDPNITGESDIEAVDALAFSTLSNLGLGREIMRLGLLSRIDPVRDAIIINALPQARRAIGAALADPKYARLVEQFDMRRYNPNASIGENLLFGVPVDDRLAPRRLCRDTYIRSILEAESLLYPLINVGLRMAQSVLEVFSDLPPGSPLFERFSFISAEDLPVFERIDEQARSGGLVNLPPDAQAWLMELAFSYVETRHHMGVLDPAFEARIVRARRSLRIYLPQTYQSAIDLYDIANPILASSILDNLLFGRIGYDIANAEVKVTELVQSILRDLGLEQHLISRGLAFDVGAGGRQLQPRQRAVVALARGLLARPDTLVLDRGLSALTATAARAMIEKLRIEMKDRTLIVALDEAHEAADFDLRLMFEGSRLVSIDGPEAALSAVAS